MDTTPTFTRETLRAALTHALEHAHTHNVTVPMRRYWADITALRELGLSWALLAAAFSEEGLSFTEEKLREALPGKRRRPIPTAVTPSNHISHTDRAAERAALARADVTRLLNDNKESERKARNHRLILQGLLLDFAELQTWDRAELLGALASLDTSSTITTEQRTDWKNVGVKLLAEKELNSPIATTQKQDSSA
jgi:hypothetical protein